MIVSFDGYVETKSDYITTTVVFHQKLDKTAGVKLGGNYEETFAAAFEKVNNPPMKNVFVVKSPVDTNKIEYASLKGEAKLWHNGAKRNAYLLNGEVYIGQGGLYSPYEFQGQDQPLRKFAKEQGNEDCISYWYENGVPHVTYNSLMDGGPLILNRQNEKVNITAKIKFIGSHVNEKESYSGKTYADLALEGLKDNRQSKKYYKNGTYDSFGDYNYVDVKFNFIIVTQPPYIKAEIGLKGQPSTPANIFWDISKIGNDMLVRDFYLFTTFGSKLTADQFKVIAAHEFGHILGLGDAYGNNPIQDEAPITYEVPLYEIMRSDWSKVVVNSNTIEMVLEAFKTNSLQKYDRSNQPSPVIRVEIKIKVTVIYKNRNGNVIDSEEVSSLFDKCKCDKLYSYTTIYAHMWRLDEIEIQSIKYSFSSGDWRKQRYQTAILYMLFITELLLKMR